MEDMIREYEKFIKKKTDGVIGPIERVRLAEYHREMVQNFQHERLIHLLVTLFFAAVSLVLIAIFGVSLYDFGYQVFLWPFYLLVAIVVILTGFYIKHYYFLENHIQALYKYSRLLRVNEEIYGDKK